MPRYYEKYLFSLCALIGGVQAAPQVYLIDNLPIRPAGPFSVDSLEDRKVLREAWRGLGILGYGGIEIEGAEEAELPPLIEMLAELKQEGLFAVTHTVFLKGGTYSAQTLQLLEGAGVKNVVLINAKPLPLDSGNIDLTFNKLIMLNSASGRTLCNSLRIKKRLEILNDYKSLQEALENPTTGTAQGYLFNRLSLRQDDGYESDPIAVTLSAVPLLARERVYREGEHTHVVGMRVDSTCDAYAFPCVQLVVTGAQPLRPFAGGPFCERIFSSIPLREGDEKAEEERSAATYAVGDYDKGFEHMTHVFGDEQFFLEKKCTNGGFWGEFGIYRNVKRSDQDILYTIGGPIKAQRHAALKKWLCKAFGQACEKQVPTETTWLYPLHVRLRFPDLEKHPINDIGKALSPFVHSSVQSVQIELQEGEEYDINALKILRYVARFIADKVMLRGKGSAELMEVLVEDFFHKHLQGRALEEQALYFDMDIEDTDEAGACLRSLRRALQSLNLSKEAQERLSFNPEEGKGPCIWLPFLLTYTPRVLLKKGEKEVPSNELSDRVRKYVFSDAELSR